MSIFSKIFGGTHTESVKKFWPIVAKVNALEQSIQTLSDTDLRAKTDDFKKRIGEALAGVTDKQEVKTKTNSILEEILPEAFAVVRESAKRTLGQRHFDVQLIGGMVLNSGSIAEMRTGEGKTLVATLPVYLNALTGKGVHVVTVNDYLSRRDAVWMGQIYNALGLSVAVINDNASFVYDPFHRTLEDNSSSSVRGLSELRPPKADEASSAGQEKNLLSSSASDGLDKTRDETGAFHVVHEFLRPCTRREAYMADITYGTNNEFGFDYLRDNLEYSSNALRQRDFNYAVVDEIDSILIDESRTPLIISAPTTDAESIYKQFASMVSGYVKDVDYSIDEKRRAINLLGPGIEKAEKALNIENLYTEGGIKFVHHLETAVKAKALYHKDKEYVVKNGEVIIVDEFTGRMQPGRRWSEGLHQAIEAKEGVSIQQESRTYASITFQNFFRMYPKLSGMTGTAATSAEEFFKVYGLGVYQVPTNKSATRKDLNDQIFQTELGKMKALARRVKDANEKGQPVLIGTVSIEKNEVLSKFLTASGIKHELLNAKNHEREGEIIAQAGRKGAVTIATNMAGRGVDIKLGGNPNTQESYEEVKSLGGLLVLGTERHEARRIDNQLRGRSGRQGDPGETQFFVSFEDSLMRVFASDTLKGLMGRFNIPEDQPIEHGIISRSLESAQGKIEGFNFDSRKHVLEFDDVINSQRSSVYGKRRKILLGNIDEVESELLEMAGEEAKSVLDKKYQEFGRDVFLNASRMVLLQTIDMFWVEHLEVMDYTRSSVNLRAYGQRDPLIEYKKEGLRLFKELNSAMRDQLLKVLPHITPVVSNAPQISVTPKELKTNVDQGKSSNVGDVKNSSGSPSNKEPNRNDPCPCGSGKKYKKCHGK